MERFLQIFTILLLFLFGAGLFSFLYALCLRMCGKIRLRQAAEEAQEAKQAEETAEEPGDDGETAAADADQQPEKESEEILLLGKDYVCESCGEILKVKDLIPIASFLALKGRCRHCGAKIPKAELWAELFGGAVLELLFFRFGRYPVLSAPVSFYGVLDVTAAFTPLKILALLLLVVLFALLFMVTVIDKKTMEIPDSLSLLIFLSGAAAVFLFPDIPLMEHLIGLVAVSVPMLLIALAIPGAFGGGDIKLMAGAGLFLGWKLLLVALFLGILTGGVYGIILLAKKKTTRKGHFAFGPFLAFGIAVSVLCGKELLDWYLTLGKNLYGFR